jgi:hypothetical protein
MMVRELHAPFRNRDLGAEIGQSCQEKIATTLAILIERVLYETVHFELGMVACETRLTFNLLQMRAFNLRDK